MIYYSRLLSIPLTTHRTAMDPVAFTAVPSAAFNNTRDVVVYLPAPYLENTHPDARWETLIMHDGQNVFNGIAIESSCIALCIVIRWADHV